MKREWNRQEIEEIKKTQEKEIYRFSWIESVSPEKHVLNKEIKLFKNY